MREFRRDGLLLHRWRCQACGYSNPPDDWRCGDCNGTVDGSGFDPSRKEPVGEVHQHPLNPKPGAK